MEEQDKIIKRLKFFNRILSYVLVATVASAVTWFFYPEPEVQPQSKLSQLQQIIETRFIGEIDPVFMQDVAAQGMVASLGDPWSYYISAADYNAYKEQSMNAYVGIGVTVILREDKKGFDAIVKHLLLVQKDNASNQRQKEKLKKELTLSMLIKDIL